PRGLQHRPEPGSSRRRRSARTLALAHRAALERRHEYHAGGRRCQGHRAVARRTARCAHGSAAQITEFSAIDMSSTSEPVYSPRDAVQREHEMLAPYAMRTRLSKGRMHPE